MKKRVIVLSLSLSFLVGLYALSALLQRIAQRKNLRDDATVLLARENFSDLIKEIQGNRIKYIEILYVPKEVIRSIACDMACIETQYQNKARIEYLMNPKGEAMLYANPMFVILRNIDVSKAKYERDYFWKLSFLGRDNKLFMSIAGAKSGDVLINNEVAVHLDSGLSEWVSAVFGYTPQNMKDKLGK